MHDVSPLFGEEGKKVRLDSGLSDIQRIQLKLTPADVWAI